MAYAIGRGVRVEIGTTEGTSIPVTAVTAAKPPVATATGHALLAKSLGYFATSAGMPALEGQAVRFSSVATNTLTLEDLDTTTYGTFTAGTLIPITAWTQLFAATDYSKTGGDANPLEVTTLADQIKQFVNGQNNAEAVAFQLRMETLSSAALQKIREVARVSGYLVFRVILSDGNMRFFRGQPSLPTETLGQSAVGSGSIDVTIKGYVLEGAA